MSGPVKRGVSQVSKHAAEDAKRLLTGAFQIFTKMAQLESKNVSRVTTNFVRNNQHSLPSMSEFMNTVGAAGKTGDSTEVASGTTESAPEPPKSSAETPSKSSSSRPRPLNKRPRHEPADIASLGGARDFKPVERAVPASPFARVIGFGGIAARLAMGTIGDAAKSALSMADPSASAPGSSPSSSLGHSSSTSSSSSSSSSNSKTSPSGVGSARAKSTIISEANATRLAEGLCRMRGAALKVGQMLSIQDESVVPPELSAILERVRDGADVMPQRQLYKVLHDEFGPNWREMLEEFDPQPIAAASIGQVHQAKLKDGRWVAMKIQYPGVARSIKSDLNNLKRLLLLIDFLPKGLFLDESMKAAEEELTEECDYLREADSQRRFRKLMDDEDHVYVPEVIDEWSTRHVLTTELVAGLPLDKLADLDGATFDQETRNHVASTLLRICLRELFEFRFMQTDPNWSNFLYNPDTKMIYLIDFGASREYSKQFVDKYLKNVKACADEDRETVERLGQEMGFLTGDESRTTKNAHIDAGLVVGEPFRSLEEYDFVKGKIPERVSAMASIMLKGRLTAPPKEAYTLHRKLSGAFLSCQKLRARIQCRDPFMEIYNNYKF